MKKSEAINKLVNWSIRTWNESDHNLDPKEQAEKVLDFCVNELSMLPPEHPTEIVFYDTRGPSHAWEDE